MQKLIAILHDGYFDGDSSFYVATKTECNVLKYKNETFEQLRIKYIKRVLKAEKVTLDINDKAALQEFFDNYGYDDPKGAWIIDEKGVELLDVVTDVDCGSDGATYQANRTAKRVAQHIAVQCLGQLAGDGSAQDDEDFDDEE